MFSRVLSFIIPDLKDKHLEAAWQRKYQFINTSPLDCGVSLPLARFGCSLLPRWISANVLTCVTATLSVLSFLLFSYFDFGLNRASLLTELTPFAIPNWIWLFAGLCILAELTLDDMDGLHARRTNSCSPVGELLDHGIDAWRTTFVHLVGFYSLFGNDPTFGIAMFGRVAMMLVLQLEYIICMCVPNISGIMFHPWTYDIGLYYLVAFYSYTWLVGRSAYYWQAYALFWGSNAEFFQTSIIGFTCLISVPTQLGFLVWKTRQRRDHVNRKKVLAAIYIIAQSICLTAAALLWTSSFYAGSQDGLNRAFLLAIAIPFCDLSFRAVLTTATSSNAFCVSPITTEYIVLALTAVCLKLKATPDAGSFCTTHCLLVLFIFTGLLQYFFLVLSVVCFEFIVTTNVPSVRHSFLDDSSQECDACNDSAECKTLGRSQRYLSCLIGLTGSG